MNQCQKHRWKRGITVFLAGPEGMVPATGSEDLRWLDEPKDGDKCESCGLVWSEADQKLNALNHVRGCLRQLSIQPRWEAISVASTTAFGLSSSRRNVKLSYSRLEFLLSDVDTEVLAAYLDSICQERVALPAEQSGNFRFPHSHRGWRRPYHLSNFAVLDGNAIPYLARYRGVTIGHVQLRGGCSEHPAGVEAYASTNENIGVLRLADNRFTIIRWFDSFFHRSDG